MSCKENNRDKQATHHYTTNQILSPNFNQIFKITNSILSLILKSAPIQTSQLPS